MLQLCIIGGASVTATLHILKALHLAGFFLGAYTSYLNKIPTNWQLTGSKMTVINYI